MEEANQETTTNSRREATVMDVMEGTKEAEVAIKEAKVDMEVASEEVQNSHRWHPDHK